MTELSLMKRRRLLMKVLAALLIIPLIGCYSLLVVNLGVVNKTAAANATELDPEVACEALAPIRLRIDSNNRVQPDVEKDWIQNCEKILEQQQKVKRRTKP